MALPPGLEAASLGYWSIGDRTRQRNPPIAVSEGNTVLLAIHAPIFPTRIFRMSQFFGIWTLLSCAHHCAVCDR